MDRDRHWASALFMRGEYPSRSRLRAVFMRGEYPSRSRLRAVALVSAMFRGMRADLRELRTGQREQSSELRNLGQRLARLEGAIEFWAECATDLTMAEARRDARAKLRDRVPAPQSRAAVRQHG